MSTITVTPNKFEAITKAPTVHSAISRSGEYALVYGSRHKRPAHEVQREYAAAVLGLRSNSRHFHDKASIRAVFIEAWKATRA